MKLIWSPEALDDVADVRSYISLDNPEAARTVTQRIMTLVGQLLLIPNLGRPGRVKGTRELVVSGTRFIVPYRITVDRIEILRVYHAARRWPYVI